MKGDRHFRNDTEEPASERHSDQLRINFVAWQFFREWKSIWEYFFIPANSEFRPIMRLEILFFIKNSNFLKNWVCNKTNSQLTTVWEAQRVFLCWKLDGVDQNFKAFVCDQVFLGWSLRPKSSLSTLSQLPNLVIFTHNYLIGRAKRQNQSRTKTFRFTSCFENRTELEQKVTRKRNLGQNET